MALWQDAAAIVRETVASQARKAHNQDTMAQDPDFSSSGFAPPQKPKQRRQVPRFATGRTIFALMVREMTTSYGRSPGGYLWAVVEPAAAIALMTAIFSLGFRSPALGISFSMFYATGVLPFSMFNALVGKMGTALDYSKSLLNYPRVTFMDALIARYLINLITLLMVSYILLTMILVLFDTRVRLDLPTIARSYALSALLAFGVGSFNCFMMRRFPLYGHAWSVFTRPLFLLSCVFYLFETVPQPYQDYLWYNPLAHVVGLMRRGFYPNYDAAYVSESYVCAVALISMLIGLLLLRRDHKTVLER